MKRFHSVKVVAVVFVSFFAIGNEPCNAHFPWLTIDDSGHAMMYFSESPAERDYHLPESVAQAEVTSSTEGAKPSAISLQTVEEKEFVGRKSTSSVPQGSTLTTEFTYGIYHGTLLKYYAQRLPAVGSKSTHSTTSERPQLSASVAPTKTGMEVTVLWKGTPLKSASVTIIDADTETFEDKTDTTGKVAFSTQAEGLTGFVIGHVIKPSEGEWNGKTYSSESHYCTVTTNYQREKPIEKSNQSSLYAPLPEPVASFGAAVCNEYLYVYSGHTGKAHDHSRDNLSKGFHRLNLTGQGDWESLPMQTPLQGLPLVTHEGKLYRVGGLLATNAAGEDADMHSVDEFSCYDPESKQWTSLPNLPERRSSHDAVVLEGKLYVAGGWTLSGDSDGEWLDKAWAYDLADENGEWRALPSLPFRRRALAVAHWNGKLIAIGGMDEDHDISQSVDCYDPNSQQWTKLADFPGEGMSGFGVSAWNAGGILYASGSEGDILRLSDDGGEWLEVQKMSRARFFHRLLANDDAELLIIGGAPLDEEGHLNDIERIEL